MSLTTSDHTPPGPIAVANWRGDDGEMKKWMVFALKGEGNAHGPLLRVVEFADRMLGIAAQAPDLKEAADLVYETFGMNTEPSSIEEMAAIVEHCGELVGKGVYADEETKHVLG